jgi:hypothetical protein
MGEGRKGERGSELIEFALVTSCLLPVLFGTIVVGLNLGRSIQVSQVGRDTGHMYARSVDFSDVNNQNLVVRLAEGLNITQAGGSGVVILSTITYISQQDCTAAGLSTAACTNMNQPVFTHRVVIGNRALRASSFGTPKPALVDSKGKVSNYMTDLTTRAVGFQGVLTLQSGEYAYLCEVFVRSSDYGLPGYESTGVYARSVF